jgi:glycosyltransferase involved in cell wall biosynthesis
MSDAMSDFSPQAHRVSVVMPAYNSANTIGQALDSCLTQTHPPHEIIVIDDGSSDATPDIVRDYANHYTGIRLIQQRNQGPAIARNRGIEEATGQYIQFCDSDDQLLPEKIARSLATLQSAQAQNPNVKLAYCRMRHVADDGKTPLGRDDMPLLPTGDTFCVLLTSNGSAIQTSTMLIERDALLDIGAYRAEPQRCAEDWDMLLRFAQKYEVVAHDETLVLYRHTPDALTTKTLEMAQGRLQTIIYAGDYPARQKCMNDAQYGALLAGRHHVLAMAYWRSGQRALARQHFAHARQHTPQGRRMRLLLAWLTYIAPASVVDG